MWGKPQGRDFDKRLEQARQEKQLFEQEQQIRDIKRSMRRWNPPTTTKLLMAFILINCSAVEIYSMVAMWHLQDLSALYSLITAVVTESLSFAVYCAKAYNETKQEELIKLQRDQMALDNASPADDGMDESADPEAAGNQEEKEP
ncbi:MAG: hypothetical protein LIO54_08440 [Oscillospiraceae bacterium]|nr:hypothetical protein [Oscillospiraceae bacterium]